MGSTGTGNFGDYRPSGATRCDQPIDAELEDVAQSEYVTSMKAVPKVGALVRLRPTLSNGRIVAEDSQTAKVIGSLPTRYNYLLLCLTKGYGYEGSVSASATRPLHAVDVHLDPI